MTDTVWIKTDIALYEFEYRIVGRLEYVLNQYKRPNGLFLLGHGVEFRFRENHFTDADYGYLDVLLTVGDAVEYELLYGRHA